MTSEQKTDVMEIINMTIKTLKKKDMLKSTQDICYSEMSDKLKAYFANDDKSNNHPALYKAINDLDDDYYIDILRLYFAKGMTIEQIAEHFDVGVATIVRNKKRLCLTLYTMIY